MINQPSEASLKYKKYFEKNPHSERLSMFENTAFIDTYNECKSGKKLQNQKYNYQKRDGVMRQEIVSRTQATTPTRNQHTDSKVIFSKNSVIYPQSMQQFLKQVFGIENKNDKFTINNLYSENENEFSFSDFDYYDHSMQPANSKQKQSMLGIHQQINKKSSGEITNMVLSNANQIIANNQAFQEYIKQIKHKQKTANNILDASSHNDSDNKSNKFLSNQMKKSQLSTHRNSIEATQSFLTLPKIQNKQDISQVQDSTQMQTRRSSIIDIQLDQSPQIKTHRGQNQVLIKQKLLKFNDKGLKMRNSQDNNLPKIQHNVPNKSQSQTQPKRLQESKSCSVIRSTDSQVFSSQRDQQVLRNDASILHIMQKYMEQNQDTNQQFEDKNYENFNPFNVNQIIGMYQKNAFQPSQLQQQNVSKSTTIKDPLLKQKSQSKIYKGASLCGQKPLERRNHFTNNYSISKDPYKLREEPEVQGMIVMRLLQTNNIDGINGNDDNKVNMRENDLDTKKIQRRDNQKKMQKGKSRDSNRSQEANNDYTQDNNQLKEEFINQIQTIGSKIDHFFNLKNKQDLPKLIKLNKNQDNLQSINKENDKSPKQENEINENFEKLIVNSEIQQVDQEFLQVKKQKYQPSKSPFREKIISQVKLQQQEKINKQLYNRESDKKIAMLNKDLDFINMEYFNNNNKKVGIFSKR